MRALARAQASICGAHCCAPLRIAAHAAYLRVGGPRQPRVLALLPVGFAEPPHRCGAGALLPHHFTLTVISPSWLWRNHHPRAGRGDGDFALTMTTKLRRYLSVALSVWSPTLAVSQHRAL
jgi:hypothetical protein